MGKITDRADAYAKRLRPPEQEDNRSTDEKLADFVKLYSTREYLKEAKKTMDSKEGPYAR